jgi:recombination protein RecR
MDIIDKLTEVFKEFPGIGERQARRFVYFLMSRNGEYTGNLSKTILDLKKEISQCKDCFRFFILNPKKEQICEICSNSNADVKKSGIYHGKYFILGGLVPIVEKTTKSRVRIEELKKKVQNSSRVLKEVILAFSLSPQGDHTESYVKGELKTITEPLKIKISTLGRGLSTGTELEYSDNDTLRNALKNRQ